MYLVSQRSTTFVPLPRPVLSPEDTTGNLQRTHVQVNAGPVQPALKWPDVT